jgi:outer membrane protein assembly factor BamA
MRIVSSIVLTGMILFGAALIVRAQGGSDVTVKTPCPDEQTPGRPTLKQRDPAHTQNGKSGNSEDCEPNGVIRSQPVIQKIPLRFEGLFNIDEADLRHYLNANEDQETRSASRPTPKYLETVAALVKSFLEKSGYRHTRVTPRSETSDEPVTAIFVIDQGVRLPIAEYRFEGNRIFPTAKLANELGQCMGRYHRDYYDAVVFEYCLQQLHRFATSQGYETARFTDPEVKEGEAGLIITVQADEGVLYRVGELKFDGDLLTPIENLPMSCPIKKGEIVNSDLLSKWLFQDLKQLYGERGYIQYTAEVTPDFKTTPKGEGIVDFHFTIDSGRRFSVRRITFAGDNLPPNLSDLMLIHDGDVYNQLLYERSIETLNNTGAFEFIDKEKDANYRMKEEEGFLDIVIKLTRKSP